MATLQNIKNHVHLVIDAMESLFDHGSLQKSVCQTPQSWFLQNNPKFGAALIIMGNSRNEPVVRDQTWIIWKQTVYRRFPTVWFVRSQSAEKVVFSAICTLADVSVPKLVNGELTEKHFSRLTCATGYLANAPLRICEVSCSMQFKESVEALAAENLFSFAMCDWELEGEDLVLAEGLSRSSNITFLCPRYPPPDCKYIN